MGGHLGRVSGSEIEHSVLGGGVTQCKPVFFNLSLHFQSFQGGQPRCTIKGHFARVFEKWGGGYVPLVPPAPTSMLSWCQTMFIT